METPQEFTQYVEYPDDPAALVRWVADQLERLSDRPHGQERLWTETVNTIHAACEDWLDDAGRADGGGA